jgi:hypothetical protein
MLKVFKVSFRGHYGSPEQSSPKEERYPLTFPVEIEITKNVVAESAMKAYEICDDDWRQMESGTMDTAPINTKRHIILDEIHLICEIDLSDCGCGNLI